MKKLLLTFLIVVIILIGWYASKKSPTSNLDKIPDETSESDPRNTTYIIDGKAVTLIDGSARESAAPGSASTIITKYFGNELKTDLNNDNREDVVSIITQETGGSGNFFYVVAALNTEAGWIGSHATLLGDRIAPQTTILSQKPDHKNVIVVNYADRRPDEPMSTPPSQGKSLYLKLDPESLQFGEVDANFSGEADPNIMSLNMKTWTWIDTTFSNNVVVQPNNPDAFTLTFNDDGNFSATTDCNSMGGTYEVKSNNITFGQIASTLMYCEDSQEQDFSSMLNEVQSFSFTNKGELILKLQANKGSVTLR